MWVNAKEREKNKEKHINGAMFLTEPLLCGYIQNILSHVITMCWVGMFLHIHDILSPCNHILPEWLKENIFIM
jgi:hypothetical protein